MHRAEILTIGDELLRGDVTDTNASWLATRLWQLGLPVERITSVGDDLAPLSAALSRAMGEARVLLLSGGLGPTDDDRTALAVAGAAGVELEPRQDALETLRRRFASSGFTLTPNNEKQAHLPAGALLLPNDQGTAPGFALEIEGCLVVALPGVPREMKALFDQHVAPLLENKLGAHPALIRTLSCFGVGESQIDHKLQGALERVDQGTAKVSIHYRTSFPVNSVILVVQPGPETMGDEAQDVLDRVEAEVRPPIERYIFGTDQTSFSDAVVQELTAHGATLALAESCTGGLAGDLITAAAGSSEVFHMGIVAYHDLVKQRLLGVPPQMLERHGAVSRPVVEAMATGIRERAGATCGVGISGIAGPGGGTPDKPVGTVHFALAHAGGVLHKERCFPFDRQRIKLLSAHVALALVLRKLKQDGPSSENRENK